MKKSTKYLDIYYKWLKQGHIDSISMLPNGMCSLFPNDELFDLIVPTERDIEEYDLNAYWASGLTNEDLDYTKFPRHSDPCNSVEGNFGPLRQNIVLLMAARNNEL